MTVRTKKMLKNPVLKRRQCVVEVAHPGRATPAKLELRTLLAKLLKVKDEQAVVVYGFRTAFGGNKSTGFALVYDSVEDAKREDTKPRLIRMGLVEKKDKRGRKAVKESKNKKKLVHGKGLRIERKKAKKNAE